MSKAKFTKTQLKELIEVYQAEVRKFNLLVQNARAHVKELKAELKTAPDDSTPVAKKGPAKKKATPKKAVTTRIVATRVITKKAKPKKAKPKKATAKKATAKKATAKKAVAKKTTTKKVVAKKPTVKRAKKDNRKGNAGRKPVVTPWDNFVMTSINEAKKGMISAELFVAVKSKAKAAKQYKNDATTKILINRSLQKLVNNQKVLAKFKHSGRGFAYGLPSWGSRGRLQPAFKA